MSEVFTKRLELQAKSMFNQMPHKHPNGLVPVWEDQPESIKRVFRIKVLIRRMENV